MILCPSQSSIYYKHEEITLDILYLKHNFVKMTQHLILFLSLAPQS